MLHNIKNALPLESDWKILMARVIAELTIEENKEFDKLVHLFATNASAKLHNNKMLKQLNLPIARSLAQIAKQPNTKFGNDEQLPYEILLCMNRQVMLIANLWIEVGLINGSLGCIKSIACELNLKPPNLLKYVVVEFQNYTGPPWDVDNPSYSHFSNNTRKPCIATPHNGLGYYYSQISRANVE